MREIKFRAWEVTTKEMHFDTKFCARILAEDEYQPYEQDYTIMQYTGLKDKNGVEIYEGDIVRWDDELEQQFNPGNGTVNGQVTFRHGGFYPFIGEYRAKPEECEVIGNIYQNPELLTPSK